MLPAAPDNRLKTGDMPLGCEERTRIFGYGTPLPPLYESPLWRAFGMLLDVIADTELLDEITVFVDITILDVLQKSSTLTDEHHETPTCVVVLLMHLQMFGQIADSL